MEPAGGTDPEKQAETGQILREVAGRSILFDSEGFFYHAEDWSKEAAEELAGECGLKKLNETHLRVISFLRAPDPDGVIFAGNANDALNLAIQGLVRPFDHVVATRLEHNSVLRPLLIIDPGLDVQATRFGGTRSDHIGLMTASVNGMDPGDVGAILDGDFRIAVRVGLHCAPLVHETIGTYPRGGVRFSLGPFNKMADIDWAIAAMSAIGKTR